MKTKPKNPYVTLLKNIMSFCRKLKHQHTVGMFYWSVENLKPEKAWRLDDVYQRTLAAQAIGYEVVLEANEKGMEMKYRKKVEIPFEWQ